MRAGHHHEQVAKRDEVFGGVKRRNAAASDHEPLQKRL
jgi:hypothetical protein